ncbi:MAG: hypothetical protein V2A61_08130 [Calditrichota bacterium]
MGDEIFPILATIILVATLITLIVAVVSYIIFRVKEKHRSEVGLVQEELSQTTPSEVKPSVPHTRERGGESLGGGYDVAVGGAVPAAGGYSGARGAPPMQRVARQTSAVEQHQTTLPEAEERKPESVAESAPDKRSGHRQPDRSREDRRNSQTEDESESGHSEDDYPPQDYRDEEVKLTSAQSAFLDALENAEEDGGCAERESSPPQSRLKFRQFSPRDDNRNHPKPSMPRDESARWK